VRNNEAVMAPPGPDGMSPQARQIAREAVRSSLPFKTFLTFGDFYSFVGKVFGQMFTRRFHFREFVSQAWFITTVSFGPALLVSIPFCVVIIFQVNQLLIQIGAVDQAGAGAAVAVVREIGPIVSVLVVAGAGALRLLREVDNEVVIPLWTGSQALVGRGSRSSHPATRGLIHDR